MPARLLMVSALLAAACALPATAADPESARPVDLARYAGTWHEIARIPMWFQRKCDHAVTASYVLEGDHVRVVNRCTTKDGKQISAEGKAFVTDAPVNRRLKVGFLEILGWMPFKGDYWILDIDPDYRWVIVGGPDHKYGWILARSPGLDAATRSDIDRRLTGLGYRPQQFSAGAEPGR